MKAAGREEDMGELAERTQSLLDKVKSWPLPVAVDYLIEAGFDCLEGVGVLRSGRMMRLRRRITWVFRQEGPEGWREVWLHDGRTRLARIEWIQPGPLGIPQGLWLGGDADPAWFLFVAPGGSYEWVKLPFVVPLALGWISERCLCRLAVLLNCATRCYRRE